VKNIRADGDSAWSKTEDGARIPIGEIQVWTQSSGIRLFFSHSSFTNHNRVVDRVIRTIRDGFGKRPITNIGDMNQLVYYYNNTPHEAYNNLFTPTEVENNIELEFEYIKDKQIQQRLVLQKQRESSLHSYVEGNILIVHLDLSLTSHRFEKKRRIFNYLAEFLYYKGGNVCCKLNPQLKTRNSFVEIPIYYTRFLADNIDMLDDDWKNKIDTYKID
jgi:hypothetical protein